MGIRNNRQHCSRAIHPGEFLREELQERGIKPDAFADAVGMPASHIDELICGKRNMTEALAAKLEKALGIPSYIWMSLHDGYLYDCRKPADEFYPAQGVPADAVCNAVYA